GGDRFTDSLRCLAPEGRLLVIGFTAGEIPTVKVNRLLLNNIAVVGVGWGAFWSTRPEYLQRQWDELRRMLDDGLLDPPIGATYPREEAAAALTELDTCAAKGKSVLQVRCEASGHRRTVNRAWAQAVFTRGVTCRPGCRPVLPRPLP